MQSSQLSLFFFYSANFTFITSGITSLFDPSQPKFSTKSRWVLVVTSGKKATGCWKSGGTLDTVTLSYSMQLIQ